MTYPPVPQVAGGLSGPDRRPTRFRALVWVVIGIVAITAGVIAVTVIRERIPATYSDAKGGFRLSHDRRFSLVPDDERYGWSAKAIAWAPFADARRGENGVYTGFEVKVLPAVVVVKSDRDLQSLGDAMNKSLEGKAASPGVVLDVPFTVARLDDRDCVMGWSSFTTTTAGGPTDSPGERWRVQCYVVPVGHRLYQLSFRARESQWADEAPYFKRVADSFHITFVPPPGES